WGGLVPRKPVSIGDWYLFVQSLTIFFYPIASISSFWSQFQQGLAASERVFALIDAEPRVVQLAQAPVEQLAGRITFEQVGCSYTGEQGDKETTQSDQMVSLSPLLPVSPAQRLVLKDFSLDIPAG